MEKLPKTKEQIERMIISEMQTFAECENALEVVVIPIVDRSHTATWSHVLIPASRTERLVIVHCSSLSRVFSEPMTSFECIKPTKETFERLTAPLAAREGGARGRRSQADARSSTSRWCHRAALLVVTRAAPPSGESGFV